MSEVAVKFPEITDVTLVKLAKELAMDIREHEDVLRELGIPREAFDQIREHPQFQKLLEQFVLEWNAATNAQERAKIKSAVLFEVWLDEAARQLHNPKETLNSRVELAKLIARVANIGIPDPASIGTGERFSVTINLGSANQLTFDKQVTPKVIDVTPELPSTQEQ